MVYRWNYILAAMGLASAVILSGAISAQDKPVTKTVPKRLELGVFAPAVQFELVKEGPVPLQSTWKGRVHVVEFWATWCGPCKYSAPHLTELQNKYGKDGLVILGISDESAKKVAEFAEDLGKGMEYNLAIDPSKKTHREWMGGFGVTGIPHAFVLGRDGRIAWHGHPMDPAMETQIKELLREPLIRDKKTTESKPQPKETRDSESK